MYTFKYEDHDGNFTVKFEFTPEFETPEVLTKLQNFLISVGWSKELVTARILTP